MTITAKYASVCAACRQPITPGSKIDWSNGAPVRHAVCPSMSAAPAPSSPAAYGMRTGRRYSRQDHEDCLSLGPCGPDCDYAGLLGRR